jgi:nucleoside-diphosphate-sugar epimerase
MYNPVIRTAVWFDDQYAVQPGRLLAAMGAEDRRRNVFAATILSIPTCRKVSDRIVDTMRIAVLGASGFVGGHTLRFLRESGIEARAVVRNPQSLPNDPDRDVADVCDVYALRHAFRGCDAVVHAALGTDHVIVASVAPVYAAAQAVGVYRLVYISTGSVHGQSPAPGTDETSPLHVRHAFAYNNAKVRAERKLRWLRGRGTVELVMLRPTIVFGPGSRWVFDFARALWAGTACVVDGARGICNSIYVDNLGHAVMLALTRPNVDGHAFLVGDRETVTWRDLYRPIANALGFDFDAVPSVSPPVVTPSFKERYIQPVRTAEATRWLLSNIPAPVKIEAKRKIRMLLRVAVPSRGDGPHAANQQSAGAATPSLITPEIAALHRCQWRLPNDKAVRLLGYDPPVTFAEGCRHSINWLLTQSPART